MHALLKQLNRWRFRERLIRLVWGGARLLAVMAVALAFCCALDYWYDRYADVPSVLRFGMIAFQAVTAAVLAYFFLVRPWTATPPVDDLASQAEKAIPEFDHRLVTAIQLNRKTARTDGMSRTMIEAVTREAGEMAARHRLTRLIDYSRLGWAGMVLLPIVIFWGLFFVFNQPVATALLKRQALFDVEIPRSIRLVNTTIPLWPAGEEVTIRYEVNGKFQETSKGTAYVYPEGQPSERYELKFHSALAPGKALFTATVPQSTANFEFQARLSDARTRDRGKVNFQPRPSVQSIEAWALLPEYLGLVPSGPRAGQRYEEFQNQGEVAALPGSGVRVRATFAKPIARAELVLMGVEPVTKRDNLERRAMVLAPDRLSAEDRFDLNPGLQQYRIEIADDNGFTNLTPPTRALRLEKDEPPEVELLTEALKNPDPKAFDGKGPIADYDLSGVPLVLGGDPCRIGYSAASKFGIDQISIYYRINNEMEKKRVPVAMSVLGVDLPSLGEREVEKWNTQRLNPVNADLAVLGPFVPEIGLFQKSGKRGQVELYKVPSENPEESPGDRKAGGRYNFLVGGNLKRDPKGQLTKLEPGDQVTFCVVAKDKAPGANRPLGRSMLFTKSIVTAQGLEQWKETRRSTFKALVEKSQKDQSDIPFKKGP